jgi:hypothetical protein
MRDIALMIAGTLLALLLPAGMVLAPVLHSIIPVVVGFGGAGVGLVALEIVGRAVESK